MKSFRTTSLECFHEFVRNEILPQVQPQTVFLLRGEVGAGKTEIVKTICESFKMIDVQSTTFAFHNAYEGKTNRGLSFR